MEIKYVELEGGVGPILDGKPTIVYCIDKDKYYYEEGVGIATFTDEIPKLLAEKVIKILKPCPECGTIRWRRFCDNCGMSWWLQ